MGQRPVRRYSEAFKLQVISELESGKIASQLEARRKYGICGGGTIRKWLLLYGKAHLIPGVLRVEKADEGNRLRELEREVQQLKAALADAHMEAVMHRSWLKLACEEFGGGDVEEFKKKHARGPLL